ncbi:MAG: hypothetical protein R3F59_30165 [Myxococcota bacterium]
MLAYLPAGAALSGAVAWSTGRLDPDTRRVLAALAALCAPFDADAAVAVAGPDAAPALRLLVDASLVHADGERLALYEQVGSKPWPSSSPADAGAVLARHAAWATRGVAAWYDGRQGRAHRGPAGAAAAGARRPARGAFGEAARPPASPPSRWTCSRPSRRASGALAWLDAGLAHADGAVAASCTGGAARCAPPQRHPGTEADLAAAQQRRSVGPGRRARAARAWCGTSPETSPAPLPPPARPPTWPHARPPVPRAARCTCWRGSR